MPQLGLLTILVMIPLHILSGGVTPRESMPELVQQVMLVAPTTHFVQLAQAVLFRSAGVDIVWPQLLAIATIGALFFIGALSRLRKSLQ
jgi:ABC-2 type transport system permease protein